MLYLESEVGLDFSSIVAGDAGVVAAVLCLDPGDGQGRTLLVAPALDHHVLLSASGLDQRVVEQLASTLNRVPAHRRLWH